MRGTFIVPGVLGVACVALAPACLPRAEFRDDVSLGVDAVSDGRDGSSDGAFDSSMEAAVDGAMEAAMDASFDGALDTAVDSPPDATDVTVPMDVTSPDSALVDVPAVPCDGAACSATVRLLSPLSGSSLATRTPLLTFTLSVGADAADIDLCRDRAMTVECLHIDAATSGPSLTALEPGAWFWTARAVTGGMRSSVTSPVWEFFVPINAPTPSNATLAIVPDVNGDGVGDAILGSASSGSISVAYGSASGFSATVVTASVLTGYDPNANSWLSHCDVNGDGFVDVIVGAPTADGNDGAVSVMLGGSTGLAAGTRLGFARVSGSRLGWSVSCAGDLDGDGLGDVIAGAPTANSSDGAVYVLTNVTGTPSMRSIAGPTGSAGHFGQQVVSGADLDADGATDLLVAEPLYGTSMGRVHVYHGLGNGMFTAVGTPYTGAINRNVGVSLALVGDVDGDGRVDYAFGEVPTSAGGTAHVIRSGMGLVDLTGAAGNGTAIAGYDLNRDGSWDVAVGSPRENTFRTYLGPDLAGSVPVIGGTSTVALGQTIAFAGDVNGDPAHDILVSAPGTSSGEGRVIVYGDGAERGRYAPVATTTNFGAALSR